MHTSEDRTAAFPKVCKVSEIKCLRYSKTCLNDINLYLLNVDGR